MGIKQHRRRLLSEYRDFFLRAVADLDRRPAFSMDVTINAHFLRLEGRKYTRYVRVLQAGYQKRENGVIAKNEVVIDNVARPLLSITAQTLEEARRTFVQDLNQYFPRTFTVDELFRRDELAGLAAMKRSSAS